MDWSRSLWIFKVKGTVPHATSRRDKSQSETNVFQQGTISTICHKIWNKSIGSPTFDPRRPGSSAAKQAKTKVFLGFTWLSWASFTRHLLPLHLVHSFSTLQGFSMIQANRQSTRSFPSWITMPPVYFSPFSGLFRLHQVGRQSPEAKPSSTLQYPWVPCDKMNQAHQGTIPILAAGRAQASTFFAQPLLLQRSGEDQEFVLNQWGRIRIHAGSCSL